MKNDKAQKSDKTQIINDNIVPYVKEKCIDNVMNGKIEDTKELMSQMDEYEDKSRLLDVRLNEIKSHNMELKQAIPDMDEQIELLKKQLETLETVEVSAEVILNDAFKPKDPISQEILKQ